MEVEAASSTVKCEGGDDQPTLSVSSDDDLGPPSPAGRGPSASGGVPSAGVAGFVPPEPPEPERPSSLPLCKHQELCREVEVKKEGPNKGRHFFVCPRVREEQCDFFAWADRALPTSSRRDVQLGRESIMEGGEGDTTSKINATIETVGFGRMAERPKAKRTPVLAFVGGVSQSIDALVEILEENLKMAQDAPLPEKISKATQKLKDSVGHLQRQMPGTRPIEETVSRSEEVGQEHTLSLVPLGRGSVPKAPLQALDVNEPIPVEAPPRPSGGPTRAAPGENELEEVVPMTSSGNVGFSTTSNEMGFSTTSGDMVMPRISEGCPSQFGGSMAKMPELDDEEEIHDFNFCHLADAVLDAARLESLLTDLLPPESAAQFSQLQHWTTLPRRDSPYVGDAWTFAEKPMEEQYIFCFYWTLGVMRTMPAEVTPVNFPERIFVLLFMFFALSAFAVSVASLTQAYFKIFERGRTFNDEYFYVRMYLNRFGAQKPLEARVKQFLGHLFERRRIMAKDRRGRGEVAESTWLLCSGRLQVYDEAEERWTSTTGKHRVTVIDYETLATPEPYHSTLTVSTATVCELLQISKAIFLKFAGHNQAETTRQWRKKQEQSNKGVIKVQFSGLENTEEQNTICASATTAVLMSGH
eukprot:g3051.t1